MRRVSEYVGQSIVSTDSGERVGTVADVFVDAQAGRIVGVIVSGGVLTSEHVLPYADAQVIGSDAVIASRGNISWGRASGTKVKARLRDRAASGTSASLRAMVTTSVR